MLIVKDDYLSPSEVCILTASLKTLDRYKSEASWIVRNSVCVGCLAKFEETPSLDTLAAVSSSELISRPSHASLSTSSSSSFFSILNFFSSNEGY